ncbi:hypothetical protein [Grimontia marina]|uniref:Uncharacterized protein n=1 Tax=Grimontia marina TaxID=646534 RepID=A0A128FFI8_9GAMM|nr:hypothetical protein [Grimontia marina]CZF85563.1 hypothetical protein GMA8713_03612 [Grimontia marina]
MLNSQRHAFIKANQLVTLLLVSMLSFPSMAYEQIEHNIQLVEELQKKTAPLIEKSQKNGRDYQDAVSAMSDVLEKTESPMAAVRSGDFNRLVSLARSNASLGNNYINEYKVFLDEIDKSSTCYRPDFLSKYRESVAELNAFADALPSLKAAANTEIAASEVMMALSMNGMMVSGIPSTFMMSHNLCVVGDAASVLEQLSEVEGAIVKALVGQAILAEDPDFDLPPEMLDDEFAGEYLANADSYPEDDFLEDGHFQDEYEEIPSPLISELTFADPQIEKCLKQSADMDQAERVNDLSTVICELPKAAKIHLNDLAQFPYLNDVMFSGGEIESLSPLNSAESLSQILIDRSTIHSFGDLSNVSATAVFSNVNSGDWGSLTQSGMDYIVIEQPGDCGQLAPLLGSGAVIAKFAGDDAPNLTYEDVKSSKVVVTDCRKDSVF